MTMGWLVSARWRSRLHTFLTTSVIALAVSGCARSDLDLGLPDAGPDAGDAGPLDAGPLPEPRSSKLDLLLVLDNSQDTALQHELLAQTLPYLTGRLARPACVNGLGNVVAVTPSPDDPCPAGVREFAPLRDVHIAIVTTSLGGHGADTCSPASPSFDPTQNDAGHLVARAPGGGIVPTYAGEGFLAWDPGQQMAPPGDSDLPSFTAKLAEMARGVGTTGCGFEAPLESLYRFLVDPSPYQSIAIEDGNAVLHGKDALLLQQRADFLRPDSTVLTVVITDEDDCSTRDGGRYYLSMQTLLGGATYHLPRARAVCATDPSDACCSSCGQKPAGCGEDPTCDGSPLSKLEDPLNLRCFDQKRRFGIEFLYPTSRYVDALSKPTVRDRDGHEVPSPLVSDARPAERVLLAGIVGVPWQDIALDPQSIATGFTPASSIDWTLLLPNPETGDPPRDPLMRGSVEPRSGTHPITGDAIAPPDASSALANPINGHERLLPNQDDLQYSCIYPRPAPVDCSSNLCDCSDSDAETNPICQQPDGSYSTVSHFARAEPPPRILSVLQALGDRAALGSVCAPVTTNPAEPTFGYKPAVDAILRTLRAHVPEAK
jgi:hypothetical protein